LPGARQPQGEEELERDDRLGLGEVPGPGHRVVGADGGDRGQHGQPPRAKPATEGDDQDHRERSLVGELEEAHADLRVPEQASAHEVEPEDPRLFVVPDVHVKDVAPVDRRRVTQEERMVAMERIRDPRQPEQHDDHHDREGEQPERRSWTGHACGLDCGHPRLPVPTAAHQRSRVAVTTMR
jgi:hypothetical protein